MTTQTANPYLIRCPSCRTRNRIPFEKLGQVARCGKCGGAIATADVLIPQPHLVTDANFESTILKSPIPALVFAWAPWCATCNQVAPLFDSFAQESKGRVRAGKLNVDANRQLANRFNILSVPRYRPSDSAIAFSAFSITSASSPPSCRVRATSNETLNS